MPLAKRTFPPFLFSPALSEGIERVLTDQTTAEVRTIFRYFKDVYKFCNTHKT